LFADDAGARVAADWAIARSLSELNKATETGKLQDVSPERLEAQKEEAEEEEADNEGSV
jgi:hypothetical protein